MTILHEYTEYFKRVAFRPEMKSVYEIIGEELPAEEQRSFILYSVYPTLDFLDFRDDLPAEQERLDDIDRTALRLAILLKQESKLQMFGRFRYGYGIHEDDFVTILERLSKDAQNFKLDDASALCD